MLHQLEAAEAGRRTLDMVAAGATGAARPMETAGDVSARMDRLPITTLHMAAVILCALGFMFDLLEIALGSVLSAVFSTPPNTVPSEQLSFLLSAVYIGAIVGAPALGWWADRYGRRNTLIAMLLWLALTSLAAAFSEGVTSLTVYRILGGLALGAYPPIMIAFLTDILPPNRRGMMIFVTVGIASLGPVLGIFVVRALTPLQPFGLEAWRWGFLLGGLGSAVFGLLFRALPESPRWLQAKGRQAQADAACRAFENARVLLIEKGLALDKSAPTAATTTAAAASKKELPDASPQTALSGTKRWSLVGALFLLSPWSTVAFPLLTGAILTQKGFKLSDTLLYVGFSSFGPLVGALLASTIVDRVERRLLLALCAAAMLAAGAGFIASDTPGWLIFTSVAFSLAGFLYVSTVNVYGAELFPTHTRAASIAGAWALNRFGAAVAPFVLLPLLRTGGTNAMFAVIAATLAASIVLLAFGPPGQQRRALK